jgi:polar amino acid transport system permease protein
MVYIQVIQSIPVLMVLFMSYYGLTLVGIELPPLSLPPPRSPSMSPPISPRSGAGRSRPCPVPAVGSLRLARHDALRAISLHHLPQALRISLPPTVGFLVQLVKNTSIVSVVGFIDLVARRAVDQQRHVPAVQDLLASWRCSIS